MLISGYVGSRYAKGVTNGCFRVMISYFGLCCDTLIIGNRQKVAER